MGEFRISHIRITFGRRGGGMKRGDNRVVGWSRLVVVWRLGWSHPHIPTPHTSPRRQARRHPHPPLPTPNRPISAHTAEDALEGLYFGDRRILRCLPYFFEKTRPRASYGLLEAFSPSWGRCGASPNPIPHLNALFPTPHHTPLHTAISPTPLRMP